MSIQIPNPKYYSALKRGSSTHWIKDTVPLGDNPPCELSPVDNVITETTVQLYDKQLPVFNDVVYRSSSLVYAKTAFGKTALVAALTQAWGGRTLILSHSQENVLYIKGEVEKFTSLKCGVYYGIKKDIKDCTVTTFASFRKKSDILSGFDNIIVDECDTFFTEASRAVLCRYPAIRKIGLTGTIRTAYDIDRPPFTLELFYGYLHTVEDDIEDTPLESVYYRKYKKEYKDDNGVRVGANNWMPYRELLDADIDRKIAMLKYIQQHSDGFALVLFDRVADVQAFYRSSQKRGIKCYMSYGSQPTKERKEHMEEFKSNGGILYAQYKCVGRGFNFPALDKAFILFPMKSESNTRQITGRILRVFGNKKSFVFLWADSSLAFQLKEQKKVFKEYFNIEPRDI